MSTSNAFTDIFKFLHSFTILKSFLSFISVANAPMVWQQSLSMTYKIKIYGNQRLVLNLLLMCEQIIVLDNQKADVKINLRHFSSSQNAILFRAFWIKINEKWKRKTFPKTHFVTG